MNRGRPINQRKLSDLEKGRIKSLLELGLSKRQIALTVKCSRNTVLRYSKDYKPNRKRGQWPAGIQF